MNIYLNGVLCRAEGEVCTCRDVADLDLRRSSTFPCSRPGSTAGGWVRLAMSTHDKSALVSVKLWCRHGHELTVTVLTCPAGSLCVSTNSFQYRHTQ